jgi:hypothetical protein
MREPADCPESVNQKENSDGAQYDDHDGLSLRLRHLNLPTTTTDITQKIAPPVRCRASSADRDAAQEGLIWPNRKGPRGDGEEIMIHQLGHPPPDPFL